MADRTSGRISRRAALAGLAAQVPAGAAALEQARRPMPRPAGLQNVDPARAIIASSGLGDVTGFVLRDVGTGRILASHQPYLSLPPASVAKVITALYAMEALGPSYRFQTRVVATGPISGGVLQGDLYLVGDGDPVLDTDAMADLVKELKAAGLRRVAGKAYVVANRLPYLENIDPGQPVHVGYNPAISGLNLNFNRVYFEWKRAGGEYALQMTARGERYDPAVASIRMAVARREMPVFTYNRAGRRDDWSVARGALGKGGSRWLPVRRPADYAGEVFRELARSFGISMPAFGTAPRAPEGRVLAERRSASNKALLRGMLRYSTNLTAEVIGLRASQARGTAPRDLKSSAGAMTEWLRAGYGVHRATFLNHSGLTAETKMTAEEMAQVLDIASAGPLPELLKEIRLTEAPRSKVPMAGVRLAAKTGTLNFTRALSGYLERPGKRRLGFAIFAADLRARARAGQSERPRGSASWRGAAKAQEMALLRAWARTYL